MHRVRVKTLRLAAGTALKAACASLCNFSACICDSCPNVADSRFCLQGIGLNQRIGNVLRVSTHQDGVGPNVWVKFLPDRDDGLHDHDDGPPLLLKASDAFGRFSERHFALFDCALHIGGFQARR